MSKHPKFPAVATDARSSKERSNPAIPVLLAKNWATEVERIRPVPRDLVMRGKALVEGVAVDLDAALPDGDT